MNKIVKTLVILLVLGVSFYFITLINNLNILPSKYYYPFLFIILLFDFVTMILVFLNKSFVNIIGFILAFLNIIMSIFGIKYSKITLNYLNKSFNNNTLINTYNVVVLKTSSYNAIDDLKEVGYINNTLEQGEYLDEVFDIDKKEYNNIYYLYDDLLNERLESMFINSSYLELLEDEYDDLFDKIKIIYSFDKEVLNVKSDDVSELESINILISGSDSRGTNISNKSRSDVNMIVTINPSSKTILLTSIPRDYYVQLHGTVGLKDKLTHSGIYGVEMTKQTLEDLFDIKIDYTVKVGFRSVIEIVDLIGGIDIESDMSLTTHSNDGGARSVNVVKGMNHFSGAEALSYARERYAYMSGDRHRILNQQQVLEAIITKIFKDKSILSKYSQILDSFSNLYITDVPVSYIKLFVKNQLDDMSSWNIVKQTVDGTGSMLETYSMSGMKLYVMIPNQNTVSEATYKINSVKCQKSAN